MIARIASTGVSGRLLALGAAAALGVFCITPASAQANTSATAATAALRQGIQALQGGDLQAARAAFRSATELDARSADAWTWKGIAESQAAEYADAEVDLKKAISLKADDVPAHYNLALTQIRLHETDAAIAELNKVIVLQPHAVDPQFNLAVLLEAKNEVKQAVPHLVLAHELEPRDNRITLRLLTDAARAGDRARTATVIGELNHGGDTALQEAAAEELLRVQDFADAVTLLRGAPAQGAAQAAAEGLTTERRALLARAYIGGGHYAEAAQILKGSEAATHNAEAAYLLGLAQLGEAKTSEAAQSFAMAASLDPAMAAPHYHLGLLAANEAGGEPRAVAEFETASKLEPRNGAYALAYARVLLQANKADQVRAVLAQTADLSPQEAAEAHLLEGIAILSAQGPEAAAGDLKAAAAAGAALPLAHNLLGFCLFRQGQYAAAGNQYKLASDAQPRHRIFARDTAVAFARADDTEQAERYAERAVGLPDAGAEDYTLKAKLDARLGHKQEAVEELQHAVSLDPRLDTAYYLLARTLMQMGRQEEAVTWNNKLTALKQQQAEAYAEAKNKAPVPTSSSALLKGSGISDEESGPQ